MLVLSPLSVRTDQSYRGNIIVMRNYGLSEMEEQMGLRVKEGC